MGLLKRFVKAIPIVGDIAYGPEQIPDRDPQAAEIERRARETADAAEADLRAAEQRNTAAGIGGVPAATAEATHVGVAERQETPVVRQQTPTQAPGVRGTDDVIAPTVTQTREDLGERVAQPHEGSATTAARVNASTEGRGVQGEAAQAFRRILAGDSAAAELLKKGQAKAAAEQLSIAAGARGQGVAAARRNAAANISGQQMEASGQMAELRAKEIADAAQGLLGAGSQMRGMDVDVAKTDAQLLQESEQNNANRRDAAINAARERFARGEITEAQLRSEENRAQAEFLARASEGNANREQQTNIEAARQELQARLSSDERIQSALNLEASLRQQAAAGNQQAATQLQALQAELTARVRQFNATQIQNASAQTIDNILRAIGLDDNYVAATRAAWLQAEAQGDTVALERLRQQINRDMVNAGFAEKQVDRMRGDAFKIASLAKPQTEPPGPGSSGGG